MKLSHMDDKGNAKMVDISAKENTKRTAKAYGRIEMRPETLELIVKNGLPKGDVFSTARIAGIMAAKKTWELIPMCHNISLTHVSVEFKIDRDRSAVEIFTTASSVGKTGVEMEALTAASVAALTIYDMAKAVDKEMVIADIYLLMKSGGKSGDWKRGSDEK
ncbi:cyclic pyranopterin monophosphate synthase MoaC [Kosmotoga sp. DU53]|uniref:cyclic pyranopterin monophosphate synthase MoaC n=1 Tax=Kosmotoga sp. DU53 TaxID=1310160 RepID=UPI0007C5C475|nr:cyclic pyranopterin monophosphate synthase MoaC [Kosmotoga sp. DU53]OAA21239.1 molybdenum cofactor biosynthesis protein C [Kosmotoga sp. DU53]